jgi:hypothetical protein
MAEPWSTLLTAGVAPLAVAYLTYRGLQQKEAFSSKSAEASRLDAALRDLLDRQTNDNARLRSENADLTKVASRLMTLARRWCDLCHEMRHGRNNDRHRANLTLEAAKQEPIEWKPVPPLPGFEEIE